MRNKNFTTKKEYLQYRKDWKEEYKTLSQNIREHKLIRRYLSKTANEAMKMVGGILSYDNTKRYFEYINTLNKENEHLQELLKKHKGTYLGSLRKHAREMLAELKEAKIEANRQYLANKQLLQTIP